ncbi:outer membrane lipid asymmetry maintenance protein MlaD [Rickettsia prowazekii]|uniref:Mce/MlaD domain-containing protein n=2 Tax=Rickettsia prowazekii TaxID=782 RepID=Q9ZCK5_RICPR|nr:outer membrane lipid asymmetry maintenance protein MlaD [Rickettsia prowazekii]EOB10353.1 ABC transporter substrate binding protein [Rickettsia prowazekii str. GvF12]ADE30283.1 ABC transporter substrate binding protein [Rickettsia prowazekii str. Rp22]AFE49523.1 ABC transporter substrate binding protein [Rickettsia prowazekii str. Chernikova]AFE50367.1 ABC transporter substrate binding protein [Rickettsia prowazekii str. Katsinyian]AFE51212.1 ABC transporter substrate binding protein [Ricke
MQQNIVETIIGFLVLIIGLLFLIFAYKTGTSIITSRGYQVIANFQNAEGIAVGSDVMISGIKVGSVTQITLDPDRFYASVYLNINDDVKIPKDSKAQVVTSGLLGGKYIAIIPGNGDENLSANEEIRYTQSAINIESLINKIVYSFGNK